jgi:two-component system OmpR family sensor kinase
MIIDDRLATVLRTEASDEAAARIQYHQLLDLLDGARGDQPLRATALSRLAELAERLGLHGRGSAFVGSASGLAPAEPVSSVEPDRSGAESSEDHAAAGPRSVAPSSEPADMPGTDAIATIVRRIEAFRLNRETANEAAGANPSEPAHPAASRPMLTEILFATDRAARIVWAGEGCGPMLAGLVLGGRDPLGPARSDAGIVAAVVERAPIRGGCLEIAGAPSVAGPWRVDAMPSFDPETGAWLGYRGLLRRPQPSSEPRAASAPALALGQVLHELRTPVTAIRGFAELISQQLFGPVPERCLPFADRIIEDSNQILAGLEEIAHSAAERELYVASSRGED